jgi:hypothetical protein
MRNMNVLSIGDIKAKFIILRSEFSLFVKFVSYSSVLDVSVSIQFLPYKVFMK